MTIVRRAIISVVVVVLFLSSAVVGQGAGSEQAPLSSDNPFVLVDRFIRAFYPQLSKRGGQITISAARSADGGVDLYHADFTVCRFSGVPGPANRATAPTVYCGSHSEPELGMALSYDSNPHYPRMQQVWVKEQTVSQKQALLTQMKALPGLPAPEKLLESLDAIYRASRREDFAARIPTAKVKEFTGCVLDTETAHLEFNSEGAQWVVKGVRQGSVDQCTAMFEPFEGKLTAVF